MSTRIEMNVPWTRRCPIVYLCGPMVGLTFEEANAWRVKADEFLGEHYIETLSPLRHLAGNLEGKLTQDGRFTNEQFWDTMGSDRSINTRDKLDVKRSDLVLANFEGVTEATVGSFIELGWADILERPVVAAINLGEGPQDHPMVRDIISWPTVTLDLALEVVVQVLR